MITRHVLWKVCIGSNLKGWGAPAPNVFGTCDLNDPDRLSQEIVSR